MLLDGSWGSIASWCLGIEVTYYQAAYMPYTDNLYSIGTGITYGTTFTLL